MGSQVPAQNAHLLLHLEQGGLSPLVRLSGSLVQDLKQATLFFLNHLESSLADWTDVVHYFGRDAFLEQKHVAVFKELWGFMHFNALQSRVDPEEICNFGSRLWVVRDLTQRVCFRFFDLSSDDFSIVY